MEPEPTVCESVSCFCFLSRHFTGMLNGFCLTSLSSFIFSQDTTTDKILIWYYCPEHRWNKDNVINIYTYCWIFFIQCTHLFTHTLSSRLAFLICLKTLTLINVLHRLDCSTCSSPAPNCMPWCLLSVLLWAQSAEPQSPHPAQTEYRGISAREQKVL